MDETEKYKQRLEAIAEKRRLQEDQDRARRDMEDEKLRLQQLKRKSLRDQWLMEGAPLSPSSPDAQSPRSPLWGAQAQEMEKHIDKLESESQRLAEEEETLKEQMGDGQTEAGNKAEAGAEMVQGAVVVQNGEDNGSDEGKTKSTPLDETVLTNGDADADLDTRASANGMQSEPGLSSGASVAQPAPVPHVNFNEEEGLTLVTRAERVIITDEGDDVAEEPAPQRETTQTEEAGQEGGGAAPETFTQPEKSEAAEGQAAPGAGDPQGGVKTSESGDGEGKSEGRGDDSEGPTCVQLHPQASHLEGAAVASVPVYSEVRPPALAPEPEAEGEAAASPEGAEAALKAPGPAPAALPGRFQEVPLADPQERGRRTEAGPVEREPLLSQAKASDAQAGPAAAAAAASTETQRSARAGQREEAEGPKHKTCQCCSVM